MASQTCTRCKRERYEKYLTQKNLYGKFKWRCKARSVCASIARRNKAKQN